MDIQHNIGIKFMFYILIQIISNSATDPRIVSKTRIEGDCVDGSGNIVADGNSWSSGQGVCDLNTCHQEFSGNYIVKERCRPLGPNENPDPLNCQTVTKDNQPFPGCCPKLECNERDPLTTQSPTVCLDMATDFSCEFWKNETSGCQPGINDALFDYVQNYCRQTCGLC